MTGLRTLHAFCTRDPGRGYPSRLEIQRELERLLNEEAFEDVPFAPCLNCNVVQDKASQRLARIMAAQGRCPNSVRDSGPCYRTEDCPAGFEYDSVRNACGPIANSHTIKVSCWESDQIDEGTALMLVENKDGSVSAAVIKNIGRE
jgi:hypothetical protein